MSAGGLGGDGEAEGEDLLARAASRLRAQPVAAVLAVALLLGGLAFAFGGILDHALVNWDDQHYGPANARLRPPLDPEKVRWMLTDRTLFYWHPVAYLVAAAQNALFGDAPGPRHGVSLALHAVNALLVLGLALAVLPPGAREADESESPASRRWALAGGFAAAALWGLHPLRAEPVAWFTEQKELLCTGFVLAACLAWLGACTAADPVAARRRRFATVGFALLALASKPMAVTLPGALLALDVFPLRRLRRPADLVPRLREKGVVLALAVAALAYNVTGPKEQERTSSAARAIDPVVRVAVPGWGLAAGAVRTAWPEGLVPVYPYPDRTLVDRDAVRYAGGYALLMAGAAAAWFLARRRWLAPAVAWAAYAGLTLPVSGVRRLASIETADRFSYLPTIPLLLLLGGGVAALLPRLGRGGRLAVAGGVLAAAAALGVLSRAAAATWSDSGTLWGAVIERLQRDGRQPPLPAWVNLGTMRYEQARVALREGRDADARALMDLSDDLLGRGLRADPTNPTVHINLGLLEMLRGNLHKAEGLFRRAATLAPRHSAAHGFHGMALHRLGRPEEARAAFEAAVRTGGPMPPGLAQAVRRALGGGDPGDGPEGGE